MGKKSHQFKSFAAGMCVSRLCRDVKTTPANMSKDLDELYSFFEKYEAITAEDISAIFG
jgi:hypothetical protein